MIQALSLFRAKAVSSDDALVQKKESAALRTLLHKAKPQSEPLSIISVYGNKGFDQWLLTHVPEQTEFVRITDDLCNYSRKPCFDVIVFSFPDRRDKDPALYEQLSYCRMLLKPGGRIWFRMEGCGRYGYLQKMRWKKSREAGWLSRTGFAQLRRRRIGQKTVFLCGIRPKNRGHGLR